MTDQTLGKPMAGDQSATTIRVPPFRPRRPWLGGDLQTLRNPLVARFAPGRLPNPDDSPETRLAVPLSDGSGDRLLVVVNRPVVAEPSAPGVILVHGLSGCHDSVYMRTTAALLLARGSTVARVNLRGAAPGRALAGGHYHAGSSADLADAIATLADGVMAGDRLVAVGYSLGGNALLKYLGEAGADTPLVAAMSVSAPIDLAAACWRIMQRRNRPYHRVLLRRMRQECTAPGAVLDAAQRTAIAEARSVYEFDDRFIAPGNGFAGATDYYARCSATRFLGGIRAPTVLVHAADDPWIPAEIYRYPAWRNHPALHPMICRGGGHVGFHGRGSEAPWHDRVLLTILEALGRT